MNARSLLLLLFLCVTGSHLSAQGNADPYIREADRHFQHMAYAKAAELYRTATELGAVNEHVTKRLAECSWRLGDTVEAERWYAVVVKFLNREPIDLYNYAEALKSNGHYEEAEQWMDRYLALTEPEGSARRSNLTGFARKFTLDQDRFRLKPVSINTPYSDFGTAWLGTGKVVFTSSRNETVIIERRAAWNAQPFLDLFTADVTPSGDLANPRGLEGTVNTKYHEGPATASSSGDVIWFTRNNYFKGRTHKSQNGVNRLAIYKARLGTNGYGSEEQFLFNNSEVSIAQPALSPDGRKLYFVSDMPGGFGGTDLYMCEDVGGQWSEPVNLGPAINTARNESFPFIAADASLYFCSNGHPGLGGIDIYKAGRGSDGAYASALNLGAPVNSSKDDFAFIIDPTGKRGFLSSNRPGGMGDDDIYAFEMLAALEDRFLCTGVVMDDEYGTVVSDVEVQLLGLNGEVIANARTDAKGEYTFPVRKDMAYRIVARMKGRYEAEQHLSTENIEREQIVTRDLHLVADAGVWLRGAVREKGKLGFVQGANITVVNLESFHSEVLRTGDGGDFDMRMQSNEEFEVIIEKPGYFGMSIPVSTIGMKQGIIDLGSARDLELEPIVVGQPIELKYVRWSNRSVTLEPQAKGELDALAERLKVNAGVTVEIGVHSDARGDATAETKLTQDRADAISAYLRGKGVPKERIKARGFGAGRLMNHCAPGVQCSEAEHAVNRRTEYTVTSVAQ